MDIRVENVKKKRLVALRHIGPYNRIGRCFGQLSHWAELNGFEGVPLAVFHDDPHTTPEDELRADACLAVGEDFQLPDGAKAGGQELTISEVGPGEYAVTTHLGYYDGLELAWDEFLSHIKEMGRDLGQGPCFEIYLNDCSVVPEKEVRTDLYTRLK